MRRTDPGRLQRLGIAGAVLVLLALAVLDALAVPPFLAGDESAHTNYALEVSQGRLPLFEDRFPERVPGIRDTPTWTAMHPPLYYALVALPLRLGVEVGAPLAGLYAARLLTVLLAAGAVVLTARLAGALVPGRPAVPVVAAGALAVLPSFAQVGALVYNDALAVLTTAATLLAAVTVVRHGCTRRRLVLLALSAAAAAATRATGLEVAALAALAATTPAGNERGQPWQQRWRPALVRAACVAAAVALTSGWAYLRNLLLYGSLDGSSRAVQLGTSLLPVSEALTPRFWLGQHDQLWGYVVTNLPLRGASALLARALLAAALAGLLVGLGRSVARRLRARRVEVGGPLALAWALCGGHAVVTLVAVVSYLTRGGTPYGRYFFSLLPLLPVLHALGWTSLPGARRGLPAVALLASAGLGSTMTLRVLDDAGAAVGAPTLLALAVPLVVGLALLVHAALRLGAAQQHDPPHAARGARRAERSRTVPR